MAALAGERVLLGVSGGIAAYKAADLVRRLRDAGAAVQVVMTAGAQRFVTPLSFAALSGRPVRTTLWDEAAEAAMGHIELARWATRILVAPASADLIARLAQGRADDLLSTLCLASAAPLAVAPAMNRLMWSHAATQANVGVLRDRGAAILGPGRGDQACGETGDGRMLEPLQLVDALVALRAPGALAGRRVLVSAGPTYEDLDPVRYLGNRSSGKMGFALAAEAAAMGAQVTLVAGPVALATPAGVRRVDVRSAAEMHEAVLGALPGQDAYLGAAAIADYRPAQRQPGKIKKQAASMALDLVRTADVLRDVAAHAARPACVLGFAAETGDLDALARAKLADKQLDLIAANDVSVPGLGFDSERNALTVFSATQRWSLGPAGKDEIARDLLQLVAGFLAGSA
jgi:phosphopantothenoylcysteine decarboxylase/phosphopantothenate--cysteine ligase